VDTHTSNGAVWCKWWSVPLHYAGECSRVCPKGVDPAEALQLLNRHVVVDYLHLSHRAEPCGKLQGPDVASLWKGSRQCPSEQYSRLKIRSAV
jgi:hypothetical protein